MAIVIPESDMLFGEYTEEQVFWLERSVQYTEKLMLNGIKCCEFNEIKIWKISDFVVINEATARNKHFII